MPTLLRFRLAQKEPVDEGLHDGELAFWQLAVAVTAHDATGASCSPVFVL